MSKKQRTPRFYCALLAAKFAAFGLKVTHHSGGQLPGVIAMKICPDFLSRIGTPEHTLFVTGTNGKTTTTNVLADLLTASGNAPLTNREGGNVTEGIASTLLKDATLGGKAKSAYAVLELDERCAKLVFPHITPEALVVTNLYRDTFPRNSHVGYIFDILSEYISAETRLILNADDMISCRLSPKSTKREYYAIDRLPGDTDAPTGIVTDLNACPECGGHLSYAYCHFGHVGKVTCDTCGLESPRPDFEVTAVDYDKRLMTVRENDASGARTCEYHFTSDAITDLYNLLAAISTARYLGVPSEVIARAFNDGVGIPVSRYSEVEAGGKRLVSIALKGENAMACSRGFAKINLEQGKKAVVLMLEDKYKAIDPKSTEFIGWFYETDFEMLNDPDITQVIITGLRSEDLVQRVLLAGVDPDKILEAKDGIEAADLVDYQHVDGIYFAHSISYEHVADECRSHLVAKIEKKEA